MLGLVLGFRVSIDNLSAPVVALMGGHTTAHAPTPRQVRVGVGVEVGVGARAGARARAKFRVGSDPA